MAEPQEATREVYVENGVRDYIVRIVASARTHPHVTPGAGLRGSIAHLNSAQALAALEGRGLVIPGDIKTQAPCALTHRPVLRPESPLRGTTPEKVADDIVRSAAVSAEGPA